MTTPSPTARRDLIANTFAGAGADPMGAALVAHARDLARAQLEMDTRVLSAATAIKTSNGAALFAAQQVTFTVGGTVGDGDTPVITINDIPSSYAAVVPTDDAAAVATGLRADLTTNLAAEPVTIGGTGADVVIFSTTDELFTYDSTDDGGTTVTEVVNSAAGQLELDLSAGFTMIAGRTFEITALNDQPIAGDSVWVKSYGLDGELPALPTTDGKTLVVGVYLITKNSSGTYSAEVACVFGDEADDSEEVAPTFQQARDALEAAKSRETDPLAATADLAILQLVGTITVQRGSTNTLTCTHDDPATTAALIASRARGTSLAATA